MVDPKLVQESKKQLQQVLEAKGADSFSEALTQLLNSHPQTAPQLGKQWEILLLPIGYDPDIVCAAAVDSARRQTSV
jgi:hypothetical protein